MPLKLDPTDWKLKRIHERLSKLGISLDSPKVGYFAYVCALEGVDSELRANGDAPDKWNDSVCVITVDSTGLTKKSTLYTCTTEPGRYYVQNRLNPKGAAFAQIDTIHKNIWVRGSHKDQPNCLIQIGAPITVVRDNNNSFGRSSSDPIETGYFGINFHHTKNNFNKASIGLWSAGCLVVPKTNEHQAMMTVINGAENRRVSYILLDGTKV